MSEQTHPHPAPTGVEIQVEPIGDAEGATLRVRVGGTLYLVDLTEEAGELQAARLDEGQVVATRVDLRGDARFMEEPEGAEVIAFPTRLPPPPAAPALPVRPFGEVA